MWEVRIDDGSGESAAGPLLQHLAGKLCPRGAPLRRIRPLIDERAIRRACRDLYARSGRPSIPPEQLFLPLVAANRYVEGSQPSLVMIWNSNWALRWLVGRTAADRPGAPSPPARIRRG